MTIQLKLKSTIITVLTLTLITPVAFAGEREVIRTGRNGRSSTTQTSWGEREYNRTTTGSNGYERNTNATWGDGKYHRRTTDSQGRSVEVRRSR